ncbi:hypothetical protein SUGI_0299560 [Cryptomeria japonica]|nr:hypothetical protein SUGI_0299560 [Cryptomeria japonica]
MLAVYQLPRQTSFMSKGYKNDGTASEGGGEGEDPVAKIADKAKPRSRGSQRISKDVKAPRDGEGMNGVRSGQVELHAMKQRFSRYAPKHHSLQPSQVESQRARVPVRCRWITSQSSADCIAYHDEEWGVPVHDDRELFELLVLVGAQADFTWPTNLSKRDVFRIAYADFDIATVASFNEEKIMGLASNSKVMQHEGKIRGVVANAKCIIEIAKQFGSFDKYVWQFVNYKPLVSNCHSPRQIPVKTPKSELINTENVLK